MIYYVLITSVSFPLTPNISESIYSRTFETQSKCEESLDTEFQYSKVSYPDYSHERKKDKFGYNYVEIQGTAKNTIMKCVESKMIKN